MRPGEVVPESWLRPLEFTLLPPERDKNWMVIFDTTGDEGGDVDHRNPRTWAANAACHAVLKGVRPAMNPFHQIGDQDAAGYHGWEVWRRTNRAEMEALLPLLQAEYQKLLEMW